MTKIFTSLVFAILSVSASAAPMSFQTYRQKPKLVLVLVIDQFRSDMLTRYESSFLPAGTSKVPGGFKYLMSQGAWFPFAEYGGLQDMTCPGHATILSGSHPGTHGIILNDFFERTKGKNVYCAQDDKDGLSPRRLRTTTYGDELKAVQPKSRVYTLALKDRSAIMLGGHRADLALWVDEKSGRWSTSSYYGKGELPKWVNDANTALEKGPKPTRKEPTGADGVRDEKSVLDTALAALKKEKLGRNGATDVLAVSLSYHDILGHQLGPDSKEMRDYTIEEDKLLANFLRGVASELGSLDDILIAFTADHGIPPRADLAAEWKLDAGTADTRSLAEKLNKELGVALGIPGKSWLAGAQAFHFYLNQDVIRESKLDLERVEKEAKRILLREPYAFTAFTRSEVEASRYPAGVVGRQVENAYVRDLSGDVVLVLKPFYYQKGAPVTHMTGWTYDRTVPLILVGKPFKPGVYSGAMVVDLAPTLSFVTGVLAPAMNEGKVLNEAIR